MFTCTYAPRQTCQTDVGGGDRGDDTAEKHFPARFTQKIVSVRFVG